MNKVENNKEYSDLIIEELLKHKKLEEIKYIDLNPEKDKSEFGKEIKITFIFMGIFIIILYMIFEFTFGFYQKRSRLIIFINDYMWIIFILLLIGIILFNISCYNLVKYLYFERHPELKQLYKKNNWKIKSKIPNIYSWFITFLFLDFYPYNLIEFIIWVVIFYLIFIGPLPGQFYFWKKCIIVKRGIVEGVNIPLINYEEITCFTLSVPGILFWSQIFQLINIYPIFSVLLIFPLNNKWYYNYMIKRYYSKRKLDLLILTFFFVAPFMILLFLLTYMYGLTG